MASQNEPSPIPKPDEPDISVDGLLSIVENLHTHLSTKTEYPQFRVARSNDEEANETNKQNDHMGGIRNSPPHLDSIHLNEEGSMISRLRHHVEVVKDRLKNLQDLGDVVGGELRKHIPPLARIFYKVEEECSRSSNSSLTSGTRIILEDITNKISDLVCKLPSLLFFRSGEPRSYNDEYEENDGEGIEYLPGLQEIGEGLIKFEAFRQLEHRFMELEIVKQICLLSFAVFPENREVHRTMLMYWWIGEGIVPVEGAEETVREVLKEFTDKKLIEPVEERRKVAPSSYKMSPFVHSSVIHLSQKIGLFDIYHRRKKPTMNMSKMGKVCLVDGSSNQEEAIRERMPSLNQTETVFNVSERYPDFTFKWFSEQPEKRKLLQLSKTRFKSLHVFYLGRWERTKKQPIQVQNPELMKCLKRMKNLRFLSFQGISAIRKLNGSVCELHKLIVLDLRECSDLTKLPEKIDSLQSLVYLDMTGCYMLEWIPMRLALLENLEVLKGFVVSDTIYRGVACTLSSLKRLKKLRKLSAEIHRDDLDVQQLMVDIVKLKMLMSLKVTWRRGFNLVSAGKPKDFTEIKSLPHRLKKLDLQRFPHETLPIWLRPHNLLHLTKLHIGGGILLKGFGDLPETATECAVKVLRLTSLPKLRVRWIELKEIYFPNLTFIAKHGCPRVTLTPCDGNGIWRFDQDD